MKIIQEDLQKNGWHELELPSTTWKTWIKQVEDFYIELHYLGGYSNLPNRDWVIQVDNERREGVGSLCVSDYEQVDEFLKLLKDNTEGTKITKENLEELGWELTSLDDYVDPELLEEFGEDYRYSWDKWSGDNKFHLTLSHGLSNIPGKDWGIHVDNSDMDSVASTAVSNYEQIEKLVRSLEN